MEEGEQDWNTRHEHAFITPHLSTYNSVRAHKIRALVEVGLNKKKIKNE